jgi:hypothetical protein
MADYATEARAFTRLSLCSCSDGQSQLRLTHAERQDFYVIVRAQSQF